MGEKEQRAVKAAYANMERNMMNQLRQEMMGAKKDDAQRLQDKRDKLAAELAGEEWVDPRAKKKAEPEINLADFMSSDSEEEGYDHTKHFVSMSGDEDEDDDYSGDDAPADMSTLPTKKLAFLEEEDEPSPEEIEKKKQEEAAKAKVAERRQKYFENLAKGVGGGIK